MASRLKRLGLERGIPIIASCRDSGHDAPVPEPESGGYMMHLANVIVYLRPSPGGASAYLVKHFDRARFGRKVELGGYRGLGRITSDSMRTLLQEQIVEVREKPKKQQKKRSKSSRKRGEKGKYTRRRYKNRIMNGEHQIHVTLI